MAPARGICLILSILLVLSSLATAHDCPASTESVEWTQHYVSDISSDTSLFSPSGTETFDGGIVGLNRVGPGGSMSYFGDSNEIGFEHEYVEYIVTVGLFGSWDGFGDRDEITIQVDCYNDDSSEDSNWIDVWESYFGNYVVGNGGNCHPANVLEEPCAGYDGPDEADEVETLDGSIEDATFTMSTGPLRSNGARERLRIVSGADAATEVMSLLELTVCVGTLLEPLGSCPEDDEDTTWTHITSYESTEPPTCTDWAWRAPDWDNLGIYRGNLDDRPRWFYDMANRGRHIGREFKDLPEHDFVYVAGEFSHYGGILGESDNALALTSNFQVIVNGVPDRTTVSTDLGGYEQCFPSFYNESALCESAWSPALTGAETTPVDLSDTWPTDQRVFTFERIYAHDTDVLDLYLSSHAEGGDGHLLGSMTVCIGSSVSVNPDDVAATPDAEDMNNLLIPILVAVGCLLIGFLLTQALTGGGSNDISPKSTSAPAPSVASSSTRFTVASIFTRSKSKTSLKPLVSNHYPATADDDDVSVGQRYLGGGYGGEVESVTTLDPGERDEVVVATAPRDANKPSRGRGGASGRRGARGGAGGRRPTVEGAKGTRRPTVESARGRGGRGGRGRGMTRKASAQKLPSAPKQAPPELGEKIPPPKAPDAPKPELSKLGDQVGTKHGQVTEDDVTLDDSSLDDIPKF